MACASMKRVLDIEDEIALEGLDGITLQGFWLRLENNPNFCAKPNTSLDVDTKRCIWSIICSDSELSFYKLPTPRADLIIHNRYEHMDTELGIVMESPVSNTVDIYPFHKVENEETGEMGSCVYYRTRTNISKDVRKLDLDEFEEKYPPGLVVIVASQKLRNKALRIDTHVDNFNPLTLAQYCILERIGRTRTMGDVTQGKHGMTQLGDAKSLFYHRKRLLKLNLITKQTHLQKGIKGASQTGSLLHLTRFFVERKSKFVLLIEHCVDLLRSLPTHTMPVYKLKESLYLPEPSSRKLLKNPELLRYIEFVNLPYTEVHPDAPRQDSHNKNGKERQVRCVRSVDPTLRGQDVQCGGRDEVPDADEEDEDEEDGANGIMDQPRLVLHRSLLQQAYMIVAKSGPGGTTQREIALRMGQTRLDSRTICRNLERSSVVASFMRDVGRQRVTHFVARNLLPMSHLTQDFTREKLTLLQQTVHQNDEHSMQEAMDLNCSVGAVSSTGEAAGQSVDNPPLVASAGERGSLVETFAATEQRLLSALQQPSTEGDGAGTDQTSGEAAAGAIDAIISMASKDLSSKAQHLANDAGGETVFSSVGSSNDDSNSRSQMATIELDGSAMIISLPGSENSSTENTQVVSHPGTPPRDSSESSDKPVNKHTDLAKKTFVQRFSTPTKIEIEGSSPQRASPLPLSPLVSSPGVSLDRTAATNRYLLSSQSPRRRHSALSDQGPGSSANAERESHSAPPGEFVTADSYRHLGERVSAVRLSSTSDEASIDDRTFNSSVWEGGRVPKSEHDLSIDPSNESSSKPMTAATDPKLQEAMINALNFEGSNDVGTTSLSRPQPIECGAVISPVMSSIKMEGSGLHQDPATRYKRFVEGSVAALSGRKRVSPHLTTRLLRRANIIVSMINKQRVIPDTFKIQKAILESEQGEDHRVDKKSVLRLLHRLQAGGYLKLFSVKFPTKEGCKEITLVVAPTVKQDDVYLTSIIEQQKLKFIPSQVRKEVQQQKKQQQGDRSPGPSVGESLLEMSEMVNACIKPKVSKVKKDDAKKTQITQSTLGRVGPKMVRLQELHQLLFYLVRDYSGDPQLDQEQAWAQLHRDNPGLTPLEENNLPRIYRAELSWRMFIPPMPLHVREASGWGFMCDVLLCLPLLVFVRIIRCAMTDELHTWLHHPVKKFMLIKLLPASLRSILLDSRRYVHNFMELINRLCYMGLVQLGPQVSKERDQRFVYLNCNATLLDTTSSSPGYHQISQDRQYLSTRYHFADSAAVTQYWYDLMHICHHTQLGGHRGLQGQDITILLLCHKPQMIDTLSVRQFTEAPERDSGDTPGDGKGAGGLDSAMFAHLKRNWNNPLRQSNSDRVFGGHALMFGSPGEGGSGPGNMALKDGSSLYYNYLMATTQHRPPSHPANRLPGMRKLTLYKTRKGEEKSFEIGLSVMSKEEKKRRRVALLEKMKARRGVMGGRGRRMVHRRIKPRPKVPKKPYYDEEDRAALRKMSKLRVDWSASEDSLLLLCKVASCYLLPSSPRPRMLPFTLVRNILHKRFPESQNKTGRACQRRINYVMKDTTTAESVAIFVEEVRQDLYIKQNFVPPRIPQNRENLESVYGTIFVDLVEHLVTKFSSNSNRNYLEIPNSLDEFLSQYRVIPAKSIRPILTYPDPMSPEDIQLHVIQTLLYSALCSRADRESYAYQLYQAYQQFSPQTLFDALNAMRASQMISYKKCYNRSGNSLTCLPLSASPFQLSMSFIHKFVTKYQYDVYHQCWNFMKRLKASYTNAFLSGRLAENQGKNSELAVPMMRDNNNEGGCVAALIEQTSLKRAVMHTFLPETIIIVDTNRTITSKLPYQKSSIPRRVNDLAEASGKKIDMSAVSGFTEHQSTSFGVGTQSSNNNKRKRVEDDHAGGCDGPNVKRRPLSSSVETSGLSGADVASTATGPDATAEDTNLLSSTFDDSFDMNDDSLDAANTSADCIERAQSEEHSSSSSVVTSCVNKRVKELQFGALGNKRRLSASSLSITISSAKKHKGEDASPHGGGDDDESFDPAGGERNEDAAGEVLTSAPDTDNDTETEMGEQNALPADDVKKIGSRGRHVTSASRLSVFMKDQNTMSLLENQDIGSGGPALLQHMQDNLLLAACDVRCQLTVPPQAGLFLHTEGDDAIKDYSDPQNLERYLLPVDRQQQSAELTRFTRNEVDTSITLEAVASEWEHNGCSEQMVSLMRDIYGFINSQGITGATREDIKRWRSCFDGAGPCMAVVEEMESAGLLLREGVARHTWISVQHIHHWLVHTQHLSRLERQSLRLQGVYCMKVENQNECKGGLKCTEPKGSKKVAAGGSAKGPIVASPVLSVADESRAEDEAAPPLEDGASEGLDGGADEAEANAVKEGPANVEGQPECGLVRSRLSMTTRRYNKDKEESLKMEQLVHDYQRSEHREQMTVSLRPWIRICGTLNRRVLDRMLGTVLFLVLEQPGVSGARVADHLAPALVPIHVHELLHLLHRLQCVHRVCVAMHDRPITLFSGTNERLVRDEATAEEDEEDVCYVPSMDCISRLSVFIGDTKYSHDFLSNDRR